MRTLGWSASAAMAVLLCAACRPATQESPRAGSLPGDEVALRGMVARYDSLMAAGDVVGYGTLWTADAVQAPAEEPEVHGRDAIQARIAGFLAENNDRLTSTVEEVVVDGNLAVVRLRFSESWVSKAAGDTTSVQGTGVQVYERRDAGRWLLNTEIWTTYTPNP